MDLSFIEHVASEVRGGRRGVLCLLIESDGSTPRENGASMWVRSDGSIEGTIGGGPMEHACIQDAVELLRTRGGAKTVRYDLAKGFDPSCPEGAVCGGANSVYMEPVIPQNEIFIFGAGHIGRALSNIAVAAGYEVTVWDERAEFANEENLKGARVICCPLEQLFDEARWPGLFHENTYAVVVTRGHSLDSDAMKLLEHVPSAYIGVIGSRSKIGHVDKKLMGMGVAQSYLQSLYRPIGLPIKAETPEEIAVCILAEIIAVQRGANIDALRNAH